MRIPTGSATTLTELRDAAVSRKGIAAGSFASSATAGRPAAPALPAADTFAVVVPGPKILGLDAGAAVLGAPSGGAAPAASSDHAGALPPGAPDAVVVTPPGETAPAPVAPSSVRGGSPPAPSTVDAGASAPQVIVAAAPFAGPGAPAAELVPCPAGHGSGSPSAPAPHASASLPGADPILRAPAVCPRVELAMPAPPARPAPPTSATPRPEAPAGSSPEGPGPASLSDARVGDAARPSPVPASGGPTQCRREPAAAAPDHRAPTAVVVPGAPSVARRAGDLGEGEIAAAVGALLAERGKLPGALAVAHAAIRNGSVEALLYGNARTAPSPAGKPEAVILAGGEPTCTRDIGSPRVDVPAAGPPLRGASSPSPLARSEGESRLGDALVAALPLLRAPQTFERLVDGVRHAFVAPAHADASPLPHAPGLSRAAVLYGSAQAAPTATRSVAVEDDAYATERLAFAPRPAVWNEAAAVRAQIEHELAQRDRRAPRRRVRSLDDLVGGAFHDLVDALFDEAVHLCTEASGSSRSVLGELVAAARAISSRVVQRHGTAFERVVPGGVTAPLVDALLREILGGVPLASRRALLVLVSAPRVESAAALLLSVPPANTGALVVVAPAIAPFASGIGARLASASAGIASLVVFALVGRAELLTPCADPALVRARTRRLLAELAELEGAP